MATKTYQEILSQAEDLSPDDQLRLVEQLAGKLRRRMSSGKTRSITELEGLGQEIWHGIDAQEYVDAERNSWNG